MTCNIYVAVNFLFQLIFVSPLFLAMVINANEFETKEKQRLTEIKKLPATYIQVAPAPKTNKETPRFYLKFEFYLQHPAVNNQLVKFEEISLQVLFQRIKL